MLLSARLLGSEAVELGEIHTATLGGSCALALSRGRFPKGYPHTDPNEDACFAATDGNSWLLAVADGHNGFTAAEAAIGAIESPGLLALAATDPAGAAGQAMTLAHKAVVSALVGTDSSSRTALTVLAMSPAGVATSQAGDTVGFVVGRARARMLTEPGPFLGRDLASDALAAPDSHTLQPGEGVVLASDGLIDFLGRQPLRILAPLFDPDEPLASVESAVGAAFAGGAGDNVALVWQHGMPDR